MSLAIVYSRASIGVEAPLVTIEVHISNGNPKMTIVGLPETTVKEAADLLASDGMLIKRPLLVKDGKVVQVGYRKPYADLGL